MCKLYATLEPHTRLRYRRLGCKDKKKLAAKIHPKWYSYKNIRQV